MARTDARDQDHQETFAVGIAHIGVRRYGYVRRGYGYRRGYRRW